MKLTHGFGSDFYSKAFQKVGFFFFFSFVFSAFPLAQHGCFIPRLSKGQLRVLTVFSMSSLSSPSNLLLQNGWLDCKLKSKQVLSGCTLFSSSRYLLPLSSCPFPSPQHFFFPSISCLFVPCLFISCYSPAFQSNLNPKPTHPLVSLPLVIKTATLSLLSTINN